MKMSAKKHGVHSPALEPLKPTSPSPEMGPFAEGMGDAPAVLKDLFMKCSCWIGTIGEAGVAKGRQSKPLFPRDSLVVW